MRSKVEKAPEAYVVETEIKTKKDRDIEKKHLSKRKRTLFVYKSKTEVTHKTEWRDFLNPFPLK